MGFLTGLFGGIVKTALTPIAVAKDVVNIATGEEADATKENLEDAVEDVNEALDDLTEGNFF